MHINNLRARRIEVEQSIAFFERQIEKVGFGEDNPSLSLKVNRYGGFRAEAISHNHPHNSFLGADFFGF